MATTTLRPNADVVNAWTKSAGTTSWEALDDSVTDPTNPRTSGDGVHITSSTAAQESEVDLATFTLNGDVVSAVRLKVFSAGGNRRGANARLLTGATQLVAAAAPPATTPGTAEAWYTLTYTGTLTQGQLDALRAEVICTTISGGSPTAATVYAIYAEVDHAPPPALVRRRLVVPQAVRRSYRW